MNIIYLKKYLNRVKNILKTPTDIKFLFFNKKRAGKNGIVLVIHESNRLGASLLLLHTAEELKRRKENVYIISRQFGELNQEYNKIAPVQIIFSRLRFRKTLKRLQQQCGYKKILMITAAVGDFVKVAHNLDYQVISEIHELPFVVKKLGILNATKDMLLYSNSVIFPTKSTKNAILDLVNIENNKKFVIKPQGTYYKKPSIEKINNAKRRLKEIHPEIINQTIIIGIGNTSFRKGFDIFVKVAEQMPQYMFLWAGKKERYFNDVASDHVNLSNNFIYIGELNDEQLAGIYSIASALLLSSRVDTLPSTIFESLLFNVPVIGSRTSGGVNEVISDTNNGILTNETSVDAFIHAIDLCFSSTNQRKMHKYFLKNSFNNSFIDYITFIMKLYS